MYCHLPVHSQPSNNCTSEDYLTRHRYAARTALGLQVAVDDNIEGMHCITCYITYDPKPNGSNGAS
jgi:DNA integrity scanning protein DisA with diadenylate cyclase activity